MKHAIVFLKSFSDSDFCKLHSREHKTLLGLGSPPLPWGLSYIIRYTTEKSHKEGERLVAHLFKNHHPTPSPYPSIIMIINISLPLWKINSPSNTQFSPCGNFLTSPHFPDHLPSPLLCLGKLPNSMDFFFYFKKNIKLLPEALIIIRRRRRRICLTFPRWGGWIKNKIQDVTSFRSYPWWFLIWFISREKVIYPVTITPPKSNNYNHAKHVLSFYAQIKKSYIGDFIVITPML